MEFKFNNPDHLIITCPVCGFSFKPALSARKKEVICPMCGFKFKSIDFNPNTIT
jgi:rubredoxin